MRKVEVLIKICLCGNRIEVPRYLLQRKKYCSNECKYIYRKKRSGFKRVDNKPNPSWFGQREPWNKGKILKEEVGYKVLHDWVKANKIDTGKCEKCPSIKNLEWSNISGEYKRDLTDWQRLCKKCHCKYDFEMFGARKEFYK